MKGSLGDLERQGFTYRENEYSPGLTWGHLRQQFYVRITVQFLCLDSGYELDNATKKRWKFHEVYNVIFMTIAEELSLRDYRLWTS